MLCSTLLFRPGNKTYTRGNSEAMVALATSSLDKNNFIHFPPGLMILKYLAIVVVVPVHLDGESLLLLTVGNSLCRRRLFPFRKRSLPFETVVAISQNGRCHLKRSLPFLRTVVAI